MMYALSIFSDGSIELFDIKDRMVESIIEDSEFIDSEFQVRKTDNEISVRNSNRSTSYFFNKNDRKEKVLELL